MKVVVKIIPVIFCLFAVKTASCQEVILLRHAKVDIKAGGWTGHKKAIKYQRLYNTAPIAPFNAGKVLAGLPKRRTDTVYVSNLSRSVTTGWLLFGDSAVVLSSCFLDEFELNVIRLPLLLPYKGWTSVSRALWLMGIHGKNNESYKEARGRVGEIADFIEERLEYNEQVIMVTHGFLNHDIAREMKKRGWGIIKGAGTKNLGATILIK